MRRVIILLALLLITQVTLSQEGVRAVVVNDFGNIRIVPALGAEVITTLDSGFLIEGIDARSSDGEWLRFSFNGQEAWINVAVLTILSGDVSALPVRDPRSIPFGGFDAPRAGQTTVTSDILGRLPTSGLRVRAGPSTGYPVLANAPRFTVFPILGRTADSGWLQVNFEGTLGWVRNTLIEIPVPLEQIPIGGIVADSPPLSDAVAEDYVATLRLLLARLDLAQPSLDTMRARWTDASLTGRASCQPYPARPSDYNIPNPLLAAFFTTLDPIITLFNDAMFNVRRSIDLFIEVCNQPGTQNPVGQATAIGALETVALADSQFAELRRRITELIPPDREIGEGECLFTFGNESEILPVIPQNQIIVDGFTPRKIISGYCFDAVAGQNLLIETLQRETSNIVHMATLSSFDNPTNFIAIGRATQGNPLLSVGPILIPETGRYLLVLSHMGTEPPQGEFGLLIVQIGTIVGNFLQIDPVTGEFVIGNPTNPGAAPGTGGGPPGTGGGPPGTGGGPPGTGGGPPGTGGNPPAENPTSPAPAAAVCPDINLSCEQLASCEQAQACLAAGNFTLDPDEDNIPCEVVLCPSGP